MNARNLYPLLFTGLLACNLNIGTIDAGEGGDEVREMGSFTSVTNKSDADVILEEDQSGDDLDPGDAQVTCNGVVLADLHTSVDSSGSLIIESAAEVATVLGCEVHVVTEGITEVVDDGEGDIICKDPMPDVRLIKVNGNGSVDLKSVTADQLNISVAGNGALTIDQVQVDGLHVDLQGAGDATLGGEATTASLSISGNGDFRAKDLTVSDTFDATLTGTGNGEITVLGTVNAEVHGDASLEVYGGAEPGNIAEVDGGEVIFY